MFSKRADVKEFSPVSAILSNDSRDSKVSPMFRIGANVTANYVGILIAGALTFFAIPLYYWFLGAEPYGIVGLYLVLESLLLPLDMSLAGTMNRETITDFRVGGLERVIKRLCAEPRISGHNRRFVLRAYHNTRIVVHSRPLVEGAKNLPGVRRFCPGAHGSAHYNQMSFSLVFQLVARTSEASPF